MSIKGVSKFKKMKVNIALPFLCVNIIILQEDVQGGTWGQGCCCCCCCPVGSEVMLFSCMQSLLTREGPGGRVELGVSKVAKFSPAEKVRHSPCSSTFERR